MAVQEEVIVNLNVKSNASTFERTIGLMDKTAKAANGVSKTVDALGQAIVSLATNFVRMQLVMRSINLIPSTLHPAVKAVQTVTKQMTANVDKVLLPAIKSVALAIAPWVPLFAAVAGAIALVSAAMDNSATAADNALFKSNALSIVWKDLIDLATPFADAWSTAWTAFVVGISGAGIEIKGMAIALTVLQNAARDARIEQIEGNAVLTDNLAITRILLQDQSLALEERITLMRASEGAQKQLNANALIGLEAQLKAEKLMLQETIVGTKERREANLSIAKTEDQINVIKDKGLQITLATDIAIKNLRNSVLETFEDTKPVIEEWGETIRKAGIETIAQLGLSGEETGFMQTFLFPPSLVPDLEMQNETIANLHQQGLDRIMMQEDGFNQDYFKLLTKRQDFETKFYSTQTQSILAATSGISNIIATAAVNVFGIQKAFRSAGVVIDTAAALAQVQVKPGYPEAIPLAIAIAANGVAQLAAINAAVPGQGTIVNPTYTKDVSNRPIESASADFYRTNQSREANQQQIVLVTEDLNTVQNRVSVTESRASIG